MAQSLKWVASLLTAVAIPVAAIGALVVVLLVWSPQEARVATSQVAWTCSMHPQVRLPEPGRCPICGMNLVPVSQLAAEQARVEQPAGLLTEPVKFRELFKEIRTVGKLDYNESRIAFITARIDGRVDRVFADFTGIKVKKGDHLLDIYSPELYSAQAELLRSLEAHERADGERRFESINLESARTKLRLLGILPEQLAEIEQTRKQTTHLTIYAPIGGIAIEKNIREQQYVREGDMLYRIAELDPIWLYLDIYEYDLGWVRFGQPVDVNVEAYPGETFRGWVVFIDPFLDDKTRTVKVRVNLRNPDSRLKPAMYASAVIHVRLRPDGTPEPTGLEGKFICPMHPEIVGDAAGRCSICEMPLEQVPTLFRPPPTTTEQPTELTNDVPPGEPGRVLAIRKSAVIDTGRRQVTYRKRPDGAYELVDLKLGPLAEAKDDPEAIVSYYPVLAGLKPGDEVVVQAGLATNWSPPGDTRKLRSSYRPATTGNGPASSRASSARPSDYPSSCPSCCSQCSCSSTLASAAGGWHLSSSLASSCRRPAGS
jgi:Cu(I)/Ag(I) efflux system membrane fusion protein